MPNTVEIVAHVDGGSRGNPGPAAYGVSIETQDGESITAFGKYIGRATNNIAEYNGLIAALEYALNHQHARLRVLTDSQLMARQISGQYKVRSPDIKPLFDKAKDLIARFEAFSIRHVYREQNREADRLANEAMDDAASGRPARNPAPSTPKPAVREPQVSSETNTPKPQSVSATFDHGVLRPHTQLGFFDGEEVDLEIHRKK